MEILGKTVRSIFSSHGHTALIKNMCLQEATEEYITVQIAYVQSVVAVEARSRRDFGMGMQSKASFV